MISKRRRSARTAEQTPRAVPAQEKHRNWTFPAVIAAIIIGTGAFFWLQTRRTTHRGAPPQRFTIVKSYPHSPDAYCQGLVYHDGFLYEGTGSYGKSSLRKVELETGKVVQQQNLDSQVFGEGITIWKDRIIQLTWKRERALVYDLATFRLLGQFTYGGEGWGLTHDGKQLIMSDGTSTLRFLDPETFQIKRRLTVRDGRRRISNLNELEYVEGEIYANVWYDDRIARISPKTGKVLGWLDLSKLYPRSQRPDNDAVLNGIAYDPKQRRLFVTGKNWPRLYEIRLSQ